MLREIKIKRIEKEEERKVLAGYRLPCHCGKGTDGLCGKATQSLDLFNDSEADTNIK